MPPGANCAMLALRKPNAADLMDAYQFPYLRTLVHPLPVLPALYPRLTRTIYSHVFRLTYKGHRSSPFLKFVPSTSINTRPYPQSSKANTQ